MVPCDIIGLNDQLISGSKPQKKAIRIRVHPGTLNASQTNSDLARSIETSSKQLIEQLFGGDWSFEMPNHPDVRVEKLQQLRKLFSNASARISHFKDCVVLNWLFDIDDNNNNNSHNMTMSSALLKSLSLKVSSRPFDDSTKQPKNAHMQIVSLSFIRDGIAEPLVELCFTDLREPKWLKTDRKDHIIDVDKRGFRIHLRKTNTEEGSVPIRRCEHVRAVSFQNDGTTKEMLLIDSQKRIDELRQRLDESLSQFQRHQKLHSNSNHPSKPHNSNIKQRRILSVLCQNTEQTLIQISGTKSLNYLFASPLQSTHNRQSTSPLHLIVGNSNDQSCTGDSLPSSPANSVDSGISSFGSLSNSPSVSPGSSPVYTRNVPFMHSYG
ncbi:unnamed protein product [Anisakis simplex]|uniref:Mitochondrial morphogenesis protein SLD7 n=1 Tax=Anisakis simplex TaxID=6269 RepID=A0A0M3KEU7_ANISI|nr:unnamed protein product [Anisakis simplex]